MTSKTAIPENAARVDNVDILLVGSGPTGAVFARTLVNAGKKVVMIDVGEQ